MEGKCDGTELAVGIAVFAVARVDEGGVAVKAVQGDETEAVSNEFVGKDRSVGYYVNEVDGQGGDFG